MKAIIKVSFIAVLLSLFFAGCTGGIKSPSVANQQNDKLPSWFLNANQSDATYYYGVGEGKSKEEAKINALNQIAGEISVSISSEMEISKTVTKNTYNKKIQKNTKASVDKIKFTNVEIIENAQANGKIYTYVKVNRKTLFTAQKDIVDGKLKKVTLMWNKIESNGVFELLINSTKLNANKMTIYSGLPILKAINTTFDQSKYTNSLSKIDNASQSMMSNASVYIIGNKGSKPFQAIVKQHISSLGLKIVTSKKGVKKDNLLIIDVNKASKKKKVKTSDPRLRGASFADVTITLKTLNADNKAIAQNRIKVLNISKEGYDDATNKTQKFERVIKKNGILNTLLKKK